MRCTRLIAMLAVLAIVGACSSAPRTVRPAVSTSSPTTSAPAVSGDSFYAVVAADRGAIEQLSAKSGAVVRLIASGERSGMAVTGLARLSPTALLVTYGTGPECSSNVAGCGPKPNTCGGEVDALDLRSRVITVLWKVGRDQRLGAAQPSPDGTRIAALTSPCVPSYFNSHLVVRRLADGASWNIGDHVPRCHSLGAPQWTADSAHLVVTYAAPIGTAPGPPLADGVCPDFGDSSLVEVDAGHAQPLIAGMTSTPPAGCSYDSLAVGGGAGYAVQACGPDRTRLHGPASLVRFDQALRVTQRWPIGDCTDGGALAADPAKGVLLSAYLFCNPPLAGHKLGGPTTVLDRLQSTQLRRLTSVVNGGELAFDDVTW